MKFFSWMQSKFNGGLQGNAKPNPVPPAHYQRKEIQKEEFSDWPDSLLAIGTFGNRNPKQNQDSQDAQNQEEEVVQNDDEQSSSSPDLTEFTAEEVGKLQKELTKLLSRKPAESAAAEMMNADLPLDRFLNCPSSLEVDRRNSSTLSTNSDNSCCDYDEEEIDRTIRVIIGRCKDVCEKSRKQKTIGKKSLSFLLKKVFACRNGISPSPSLRDTFQESRMEKLLRTMLSKKVYSQSASRPSTSMKRYLGNKHTSSRTDEEEEGQKRGKACDSGRWDKTDSEFIVLEI